MARLASLGQPFGSPGGIINIPAPAGSALAGQIQMQAWQGLGQALGSYLGQKKQQELWQQDRQNYQVAQQSQLPQGMAGPQMGMPQMQSRMGQQAQLQSQLGNMFGDPYGKPPWWVQGATEKQVEDYRGRVGGPLVQIGQSLLSPEKRREVAEAEYEEKLTTKPLTPTEQKGVKATIVDIVGEKMAKLKGIWPGAYFSQKDMEKKWENAMEATGYVGRSKVQQKQIENEFDRYVSMLNKGKGTTTLAGQYQWDRKEYKGTKMNLSDIPIPADRRGFINKLRELEKTSPDLSAEYYNKYLDKFW